MAPKGEKKVTTPAAPKQREMKKKQQRPSRMVSKQIAGDKNGGSRTVRVSRMVRISLQFAFVFYCVRGDCGDMDDTEYYIEHVVYAILRESDAETSKFTALLLLSSI